MCAAYLVGNDFTVHHCRKKFGLARLGRVHFHDVRLQLRLQLPDPFFLCLDLKLRGGHPPWPARAISARE